MKSLLFVLCVCNLTARAAGEAEPAILRGADAVEAVFARSGRGYQWVGYRDTAAKREWSIGGRA